MWLQIINESLSLVIAFIAGLYAFKFMNRFYRFLFYQLVSWMIIYSISYIIILYQAAHKIDPNDQWLYNLHMPVEAGALAVAAYSYVSRGIRKRAVLICFGIFGLCWVVFMSLKGFLVFSHYSYIAESLTITLLYAIVLSEHFSKNYTRSSPELWICSGVLIYFACSVPYFSLFNYLNSNFPETSRLLFLFITDVLANIRYLFLAFGFWLLRRQALLQNPKSHAV